MTAAQPAIMSIQHNVSASGGNQNGSNQPPGPQPGPSHLIQINPDMIKPGTRYRQAPKPRQTNR